MRGARDMSQRIFGAVSMQRVLAVADVAAVVIKREHHAEPEQFLTEVSRFAALVAVQQARHRQRNVEHVLDVVIARIARSILGVLAAIHRSEVPKRLLQPSCARFSIQIKVNTPHFLRNGGRVGRLDAVGDVEVAPSFAHRCLPVINLSFC
jgi:hypothetical protein